MMALLRRLVAVLLGSAVVARCLKAGLSRRSRPTTSATTTTTPPSTPAPPVAAVPEPPPDPTPSADAEPIDEPAATWCEPVDGECPPGFTVKVKLSSGIFHEPGQLNHARMRPDRCYTNAAAAEADGFRRSKT